MTAYPMAPAQGFIPAAIFNSVFIFLLPAFGLGYVVWIVGALIAGRNSGVSGTAQGPLTSRWFQHRLATRHPPRLVRGTRCTRWPTCWRRHASGRLTA